ncbi:hypothetical protein [Microbispora sp. ATCC PTA-5024]|uniref:hypothetical protein n=1 Tax=Microbispora sp. ATCC PTA-5024 TaxID=316330 RepID=UPI0003DBCCA9|nr:hypothetical protein [Microbispora sp. ATCC PTA-5024]ETK32988.1 hypothetical protein MPTA5024_27000 [Microbispora sp. ATCC PTA-5024]
MDENHLRTLLVRATEDRPAGIDPMPSITRRPRRVLVPSLAALGVAALASVVVTALPGSQVSAQAQVTAAVDTTSRQSYRVHLQEGDRTWDGAVDPTQGVGFIAETGGASETRFLGDLMYIKRRDEAKWGDQVKWEVQSRRAEQKPGAPTPAAQAGFAPQDLVKLAPLDPQAALQQLRSATDVHEDGAASGTGWTGQRFGFSLTPAPSDAPEGARAPVGASGTVEVDDQGRVRRLDVTFDDGARDVMEIGDYGTPVTVTAPPADQVVSQPAGDPGPPAKPTGGPERPEDKTARDPHEPAKTPNS